MIDILIEIIVYMVTCFFGYLAIEHFKSEEYFLFCVFFIASIKLLKIYLKT